MLHPGQHGFGGEFLGEGADGYGVDADALVGERQRYSVRELVDAALADVVAFLAYKDIDGR